MTFVSYARSDRDFTLGLVTELRAAGVALWVDVLDIPKGAPWDDAIEGSLKACSRMLLILSPASVASQNVKDEVSFALDRGTPILPLLYQACDVPMRLRRLQRVDLTQDYRAGLAELKAELGISRAASTSLRLLDPDVHADLTTLLPPEFRPRQPRRMFFLEARFASHDRAHALVMKMLVKLHRAYVKEESVAGVLEYIAQIGPYKNRGDASKALAQLVVDAGERDCRFEVVERKVRSPSFSGRGLRP